MSRLDEAMPVVIHGSSVLTHDRKYDLDAAELADMWNDLLRELKPELFEEEFRFTDHSETVIFNGTHEVYVEPVHDRLARVTTDDGYIGQIAVLPATDTPNKLTLCICTVGKPGVWTVTSWPVNESGETSCICALVDAYQQETEPVGSGD